MTYNPDWGVGGGGALELIETKVISSPVSSLTFSGLDGNADGAYKLIWSVVQNGSGSSVTYELRPNGGTVDFGSEHWGWSSTGDGFSDSTIMEVFRTKQDGSVSTGEAIFNARLEATGLNRQGHSFGTTIGTTGSLEGFGRVFRWENNVDNITSLDLVCSLANGIGAGSVVSLYKVAR